jgi:hypothetical protein
MNQLLALHAHGTHIDTFRLHDAGLLRLPGLGVSDHIRPFGLGNQHEPVIDE